ncbi:MAG: protein kinase [Chloroflexota bacterium]
MAFSPGENVGAYRIIEQLGQGGMATVFKAYHPALDRDVAIKVLHATFKNDNQFFERFKREAQIVAKLDHPHIIPVYDFNEHEGESYLVMRYIEGHTLKAHLSNKPLSPETVLRIMRPMCEALIYAHQQGVLHRDVKPSNIMLGKDGKLYLADFGLARMVQAGESTLSQDMMVGTPQYISPEQAQGMQELDVQTDIYSLGIVLFEMMTGQVPYQGDTPFAVVHDHIYKPLPLPHKVNPNIDPQLEKVILKALAKDPTDRYPNVETLWQSLEAALSPLANQSIKSPSEKAQLQNKPTGNNRKWVGVAGGIVLTLCVLLLIAGLLIRTRNLRQAEAKAALAAQVVQGTDQDAEPVPVTPVDQPDSTPTATLVSDTPGTENDNTIQASTLRDEAIALLEAGRPVQALRKLEQAIALSPESLENYYSAAEIVSARSPEQAVTYLDEAVQIAPTVAKSWWLLGYYQQTAGEFAAARASFVEAQQLAPDTYLPYVGLARVDIAEKKYEAASANIAQAKTFEFDSPDIALVEGYWHWQQGNRAQAKTLLVQVAQQRDDLTPVLKTDFVSALRTLCQESPDDCPRNR